MKCLGFSVLELLVALALSGMVLPGVVTVYLGMKRNAAAASQSRDSQADGRFALMYLSSRIRMTGQKHLQGALMGYPQGHYPPFIKRLQPFSDVLVLRYCRVYQGRDQCLKTAFYLAKSQPVPASKATLALFEKPLVGRRHALIEGVKTLSFHYGLLRQTAMQVTDWDHVKGIDVTLNNERHWHAFVALRARLS